MPAQLLTAQPYQARQCPDPECKLWIYTAHGPFGEDDRTKTAADMYHWVQEHDSSSEDGGSFPYFPYNEEVVTAEYHSEFHSGDLH